MHLLYILLVLLLVTRIFGEIAVRLDQPALVGELVESDVKVAQSAFLGTALAIERVSGITSSFLAPIFFASIGLHLQLGAVTAAPLFLGLLLLLAFASKLVGAGLPAYWTGMSGRASVSVGLAMSSRGAVELIIADIALRAGLFDRPDPTPSLVDALFSSVVIVAVVTTLAVPIALRFMLSRGDDELG